uniref:WD repeat domain 59 n=1 Tax=Salmo trutta TaxID=8032 RepID=A0A673Z1I6_SALTR
SRHHCSSASVTVALAQSTSPSASVTVALAQRRFLYVVNLETPSEAPRKIGRPSKWDVGTVQWNPHKTESHVFAASSNQRVDLYTWRDGCGEVHASLQGHTRVISDLDWSWFEPEYLVTSSVDTYICIWDTRDTRKPTVALSAVAGASQVKWNKRNQYLLASSHDGDVRIWDKRKPNTAVEYVAAHLSKIHGLDWHPDNEHILATSSQDNSVRFWDYRQPRKYLNILSCQVPVWKARYTPFSNGLVTVMVPQLRRENSLLLWSALDLNSPVHAFVGHDDVVLEFQWRPQKEASKDYQMVTLSRDQTLRIWRLDPQLQKLCANDLVEDLMEGISLTTESEKSLPSQDPEPTVHSSGLPSEDLQGEDQAGSLTSGGRHDPSALPQTLQQEFSLVNLQIRNVNVEMDAVNRSCVVSALFGTNQVHLVVKFPSHYPNNAAPSFQFISPTTIPTAMRTKIQKILTDTSLQKVKRNQNCLEPCVRQLVSCLESYMTQEDGSAANPYVLSNPVTPALPAFPRVTNTYGSYQDANIPFPRTSGARFCGTGCLVYFTRPITMHRSVPPTEPTPRSLSALSAYHSGVLTPMKMRSESQSSLRLYSGSPTHTDKDHVSISSFYYKERVRRHTHNTHNKQQTHNQPIQCYFTVNKLTTDFQRYLSILLGRDPEHIPPLGESSPDDYRYANQMYADPREREREQHDMNKRLLDPANTMQFDDFKKCYGEILHRWGLKEKRAEVLKFTSCPPEPHKGIEFGVYCCHCRSQARGTQCAVCKRFTFQCAICHVAVRGSSNFCLSCGHGGHTSHMMEWFRTQDECPTGCGCRCLLQSTF